MSLSMSTYIYTGGIRRFHSPDAQTQKSWQTLPFSSSKWDSQQAPLLGQQTHSSEAELMKPAKLCSPDRHMTGSNPRWIP